MLRRRLALIVLNLLSASRFVLAWAFVTTGEVGTRLLLVTAAGATDFIDGFWARRSKLTTRFGALFDPLADRAFVLTALVTYLREDLLALWAFLLLVLRDLATTLAFFATRLTRRFREVEFKARWPGKVVTTLQMAALFCIPLLPRVMPYLVLVAAAATAWAVYDYAMAVWHRRARTPPSPPTPLYRLDRPHQV